jgi:hypothetical protein
MPYRQLRSIDNKKERKKEIKKEEKKKKKILHKVKSRQFVYTSIHVRMTSIMITTIPL